MGIPVITEGAKTSHGGVISECVPTFKIHGKGVHVDGMSHECPKCSTTAQAIASNHTKSIHGKAIVLEGDKTTCGASFIASQGVASIGGGDEEAEIGPDGLPILGSDSDEMTDEQVYALNDQMIEEAIADGGMVAFSKTTGLTNESKAPKKPTKYNKDGTEKTQKQINDAWEAYYDHKHKVGAEALAMQKEEDKSFFDQAKDFFGFDDDAQTDNAINTARNAAITGARLPGTGTMAAGDTLLGAGGAIYSAPDNAMRQDYEYFVENGKQRRVNEPATLFPVYNRSRHRINKEFVSKHKGAGWTEPGKDGRSPQNDLWGK